MLEQIQGSMQSVEEKRCASVSDLAAKEKKNIKEILYIPIYKSINT